MLRKSIKILSNISNDILPVQSFAQNSVCLAMTAAAEIIVKGGSHVAGLLITSKSHSHVSAAAAH